MAIVTDPTEVSKNKFLPFLQYEKKHQPFRESSSKPDTKVRLIRYASRRDSFIFSYYRHLLSQPYEDRLLEDGLQNVPIAYRKIPISTSSNRGKCNIDFAKDVFDEITTQGDCVVVTLDISKYFEHMDHKRLYRVWCDLLDVTRLPPDHLSVFKAITKYTVVDREAVYKRLGYIGPVTLPDGTVDIGYTQPFKSIPIQLCSPAEFRQKIMGGDKRFPSLSDTNDFPYGIPQGAPLSDLLANAYLLELDLAVQTYVQRRNGRYWRYSDDITLVLPGEETVGRNAKDFVQHEITKFGDKLVIKDRKTSVVKFSPSSDGYLEFKWIDGAQGKNGLEYLGFRFDGSRVFLRDSTLSNFNRKITRRVKQQAYKHVSRFPGKSADWLFRNYDFNKFESRFGRVRDFESLVNKRGWTFWTYAKRAAETFEKRGLSIPKQIKGYRQKIKNVFNEEIDRQLRIRGS